MRHFFSHTLLVLFLQIPVLAAGPALAEGGLRPVSHEDVWQMRRLGSPVLNPAGTLAVVSVTEPAYSEEDSSSDLWLIDMRGAARPRRLTASPDGEDGVTWSPDGTKIAFSAKRDEEQAPQLYVMDMTAPGEAIKVTAMVNGASEPRWSPDGAQLAFESRVYPGAADEAANAAEQQSREERQWNMSAYETFPIRQWDRWRDDLQTHLFVQEAVPGAEPRNLLAGTALVSGPGFMGVPSLGSDHLQSAWIPDSSALVISATVNLHEAAYSNTFYHLYRVSVAGGEPEALTGGTDFSCRTAQFDNAGKHIYCLYEAASEFAYNLTQVARFDWPGSQAAADFSAKPELLTADFDRSVEDFTISNNDRTLYFSANDHGRVRLFSVASRGGTVAALNPESGGAYAGIMAAGQTLAARWEDANHPAEVVTIDPRSGKHKPLTDFNSGRAAQLDRPAYEEFWIETPQGRKVHSFLALPPGFDPQNKYPVITLIHGGPHSSSLDTDHVRWSPYLVAAPGYVVIMTDYTGSVGYGVAVSRAIQTDPLKTPGEEILQALDEAIERYPFIDGERQAALGASYGGHLVNWLQATTTRFRTLVGHAGLISLEGQWASSDVMYSREVNNGGPPWGDSPVWEEQSPSSYAGNFSTPMMLTIGEKDYRVPLNQTIAAWAYLQRRQVPGRLLVFHDANHWVMKGAEAQKYWQEVHAWLARYLD